ncbi:hypothetical protein SZ55_0665 [Pseudomonas sp. FeS53a]|nr:hypothetical protein SZ55_0665 [Pseudomonas sp. FeS53a]
MRHGSCAPEGGYVLAAVTSASAVPLVFARPEKTSYSPPNRLERQCATRLRTKVQPGSTPLSGHSPGNSNPRRRKRNPW